jgi:hypothetical protein
LLTLFQTHEEMEDVICEIKIGSELKGFLTIMLFVFIVDKSKTAKILLTLIKNYGLALPPIKKKGGM